MIELFKEIWSTAKRNKLRTSLTGFAVAWGIFMLIFLLGAGNGLINANLDQSGRFLANSMKIFGGQTSKAHKGLKEGRPISLNERDVNMTDKTFDENTEAVGSVLSQYGVNISLGENYISAQTLDGVYPSEADINKREVISGRFINDIDMKERRKVIALWQTQAKELAHDYLSLVGRDVKVGDLVFKVIGIVKDDKQQQNNDAFIPYTTLKAIYAKGDEAGNIQFEIKGLVTEEQNKEFERNYRAHLNIQHDAAPDDESAVYIWNRYMDNIQMAQGISIIRTALWVIGLFTLLSGIVGVSNIMLITVRERTREFGVMRALGCHKSYIFLLVTIEALIISFLSGMVGMLCGLGCLKALGDIAEMAAGDGTLVFVNPNVPFYTTLTITAIIIIAGVIAGYIPARQAGKMKIVDALVFTK